MPMNFRAFTAHLAALAMLSLPVSAQQGQAPPQDSGTQPPPQNQKLSKEQKQNNNEEMNLGRYPY